VQRKLLGITLAAVLALAPVAAAPAKAPTRGKYTCTGEFIVKPHKLTIKKKKRYRYKTSSKFTSGGGKFKVKGNKIKFRTGPLKEDKAVGTIGTTPDGKPKIDIVKKAGGSDLECIHV
jgi:hypothetical protein